MRKALLLVLFISVSVFALTAQQRFGVNAGQGVQIDYTNPKMFIIADIKFTGLVTLDERALIGYAGIQVGDRIPIPGTEISEAIKKLWEQGLIADVSFWLTKVEGDQAFIEVKLTERPRILGHTYVGLTGTQRNELSEKLAIEGRQASAPVIKNSELAIKKYFIEKGFLNTTVKTIQIRDTVVSDGVRLRFEVEKNAKVKIDKISFEGNESFSKNKLKKSLKNTHEKPRFWLLQRLVEEVTKSRPKTIVNYFGSSYPVSNDDFKTYINNNVKLNILQSIFAFL